MTAEIENIVLEHLRHIRGRVDQIADDVSDLKQRMTGLEVSMSLIKREVSYGDEVDTRQQITLDKLLSRIERIERRLSIRED